MTVESFINAVNKDAESWGFCWGCSNGVIHDPRWVVGQFPFPQGTGYAKARGGK